MSAVVDRRKLLAAGIGLGCGPIADRCWGRSALAQSPEGKPPAASRLSTFAADVTVPIGHPLMGGGVKPALSIADPLWARGVVLEGSGPTVVWVAVDWCEIRNAAYDRWQTALAEAAGTTTDRVFVASVHQHDAPLADLEAERLLRERGLAGSICDPQFHEQAVGRVAAALAQSRRSARRITHLGTGMAKVERVGSNRRYLSQDGQVHYDRMSSTSNQAARNAPEGTIDPFVRVLSFWDGDQPLAALNFYAIHPMSYYGQGEVSADFVGLARRRRGEDDPGVHQVYFSGCSGNVVAGKYNDGAPLNRTELANRLYRGMNQAWQATQRHPLAGWTCRSVPLRLEPRASQGFSRDELEARLRPDEKPFGQCLAALGLSWRRWLQSGRHLQVPAIDFGPAQCLLLPGESYVEYQLYAQQVRRDSFVAVAGYGQCATGYIPIERAWREQDSNLHDWCWVAQGSEAPMRDAIRVALATG